MIRGNKNAAWQKHLTAEDLDYVNAKIEPNEWYPMGTFERLGNAILQEVANGSLDAVRRWGRFSVDQLVRAEPRLVAQNDPIETIDRFRVLRSTYFDFDALAIIALSAGDAQIAISYHMGGMAEEAASIQTMGFFERLLEVAGATDVFARFLQRSWAGDPRTVLDLFWR